MDTLFHCVVFSLYLSVFTSCFASLLALFCVVLPALHLTQQEGFCIFFFPHIHNVEALIDLCSLLTQNRLPHKQAFNKSPFSPCQLQQGGVAAAAAVGVGWFWGRRWRLAGGVSTGINPRPTG